jgi:hypothetical protein
MRATATTTNDVVDVVVSVRCIIVSYCIVLYYRLRCVALCSSSSSSSFLKMNVFIGAYYSVIDIDIYYSYQICYSTTVQ